MSNLRRLSVASSPDDGIKRALRSALQLSLSHSRARGGWRHVFVLRWPELADDVVGEKCDGNSGQRSRRDWMDIGIEKGQLEEFELHGKFLCYRIQHPANWRGDAGVQLARARRHLVDLLSAAS